MRGFMHQPMRRDSTTYLNRSTTPDQQRPRQSHGKQLHRPFLDRVGCRHSRQSDARAVHRRARRRRAGRRLVQPRLATAPYERTAVRGLPSRADLRSGVQHSHHRAASRLAHGHCAGRTGRHRRDSHHGVRDGLARFACSGSSRRSRGATAWCSRHSSPPRIPSPS
jgi:hypothetical protein